MLVEPRVRLNHRGPRVVLVAETATGGHGGLEWVLGVWLFCRRCELYLAVMVDSRRELLNVS